MIQSPTLRVLVAVSSLLQRARVRGYLDRAPGITIVSEATSAAQLVQQALSQSPNLLICDRPIVLDPAMEGLHSMRSQPKVVLISSGAGTGPLPHSTLPLVGFLPLNLAEDEIAPHLYALLNGGPARSPTTAQDAPTPARQELRHRFTVVEADESVQAIPVPSSPPRAGAQGSGTERRSPDPAQEGLVAMLTALLADGRQRARDPLTGLGSAEVLTQAMALLPKAKCPAAFISIDLQQLTATPDALPALLRRTGASIRANLRQGDLVCRVDDTGFVLLLPGLTSAGLPSVLKRLRTAIGHALPTNLLSGDAAPGRVAIGVAFWHYGLAPLDALAGSRKALGSR